MIPNNAPVLTSGSGISGLVTDVVPFQFDSSSPLIISNLVAQDRIDKVEVVIDTPFDDASANLSVGTVSDPDLVLSNSDIDPTQIETYASDDNFFIPINETLRLTINPGISTQGSGVVLFTIRRQ